MWRLLLLLPSALATEAGQPSTFFSALQTGSSSAAIPPMPLLPMAPLAPMRAAMALQAIFPMAAVAPGFNPLTWSGALPTDRFFNDQFFKLMLPLSRWGDKGTGGWGEWPPNAGVAPPIPSMGSEEQSAFDESYRVINGKGYAGSDGNGVRMGLNAYRGGMSMSAKRFNQGLAQPLPGLVMPLGNDPNQAELDKVVSKKDKQNLEEGDVGEGSEGRVGTWVNGLKKGLVGRFGASISFPKYQKLFPGNKPNLDQEAMDKAFQDESVAATEAKQKAAIVDKSSPANSLAKQRMEDYPALLKDQKKQQLMTDPSVLEENKWMRKALANLKNNQKLPQEDRQLLSRLTAPTSSDLETETENQASEPQEKEVQQASKEEEEEAAPPQQVTLHKKTKKKLTGSKPVSAASSKAAKQPKSTKKRKSSLAVPEAEV